MRLAQVAQVIPPICRSSRRQTSSTESSEPELGGEAPGGWEAALAQMRFRSLLGSRWFVSTKGFLLGSQALVAALLVLFVLIVVVPVLGRRLVVVFFLVIVVVVLFVIVIVIVVVVIVVVLVVVLEGVVVVSA